MKSMIADAQEIRICIEQMKAARKLGRPKSLEGPDAIRLTRGFIYAGAIKRGFTPAEATKEAMDPEIGKKRISFNVSFR